MLCTVTPDISSSSSFVDIFQQYGPCFQTIFPFRMTMLKCTMVEIHDKIHLRLAYDFALTLGFHLTLTRVKQVG